MKAIVDRSITSYDELCNLLDAVLDGTLDKDVRTIAEVSLEICDLVRSGLDDIQLLDVEAARSYWSSKLSEQERISHLTKVWKRIDKVHSPIAEADKHYLLDRLIVCALSTKEGPSITTVEFLLELAQRLGLSVTDVAPVFFRHFPGLSV